MHTNQNLCQINFGRGFIMPWGKDRNFIFLKKYYIIFIERKEKDTFPLKIIKNQEVSCMPYLENQIYEKYLKADWSKSF